MINENHPYYYEINVLDAQSVNTAEAYKQTEITKRIFDSLSSARAYLIFSKGKR